MFLIDTGMLSSYYPGGRASALEICGDTEFTAKYMDQQVVLIDSAASPAKAGSGATAGVEDATEDFGKAWRPTGGWRRLSGNGAATPIAALSKRESSADEEVDRTRAEHPLRRFGARRPAVRLFVPGDQQLRNRQSGRCRALPLALPGQAACLRGYFQFCNRGPGGGGLCAGGAATSLCGFC